MSPRGLVLPLFLSGAGTLVLEVCWFRRMAQVAGATSVAMGAVLAAVIGGMAAGSYLFGKRADRSRRPLRLYGLLEIGIALSALLTPWLLDFSQGAFDILHRHLLPHSGLSTVAGFLLATVLLAVPAIFMGGSLPAIACALRTTPERRGRALGRLYAANTLGAVAGTLLAGFFLLPTFGLAGATRSALFFSGAAALLAFLPRNGMATPAAAPTGERSPDHRRAIALYAASGFLGLAAEVAFTRRLVLVLGSTTYAFTTTLAVFLLGIGLGGLIGAVLARRKSGHLRLLEITIGLTAALFSGATLIVYVLPRLYLAGILGWADTYGDQLLLRFLLSLLVLLPGALGLGAAFPLAAHLATAGSIGSGTGRLYAANTLASITGSTCAVFLLVPRLGPDLAVVVTALAVSAFVASRRRLLPVLLLLITAVGLIPPSATARERLLAGVFSHSGAWVVDGRIDEKLWSEGADFPWVDGGREATVAIRRWSGTHTLLINGKAVANNESLGVVQHLSLLGHLPMAVHADPQRVLVVGLGMGTTWSACAKHEPDLLRVVELSEAVVGAAAYLGVRPKDIIIADARSYLRGTREQFDVITSDPIHPWVRGGGDLYSSEYFTTGLERLLPGGVFCQWLPIHQLGVENLNHILRTFTAVFPGSAAFYAGGDLVLIGMAKGPVPDPRHLTGPAAEELAALGLSNLAGLRVANGTRLREVAGAGPILLDDALTLEYSAPRFVDFHALADCLAWLQDLWVDPPFPYDHVLESQRLWARGDYESMWAVLTRARRTAPDDRFVLQQIGELNLYDAQLAASRGQADLAMEILENARQCVPGDVRLLGVQAEVLAARGENRQARELLRQLLSRSPDSAYLNRKLAALTRNQGDLEEECDLAVLRGMSWLTGYLDREETGPDIGMDRVFLFLELGATSRHAEIRSRAMATARRYAKDEATKLLAAPEPLDRTSTVELLELVASAEPLGLDAAPLLARARRARAAHGTFQAIHGVAFEDLALISTPELFETVMSVYGVAKAEAVHGAEFRIDPGIAEVLAVLADLPLISAADDPAPDRATFRENAYLVTHFAYLLSDYNRIRLERDDAPWLIDYVRENFDAVLKARDVELVAEFVDVYRSLGLTGNSDEDVRDGTEFLLATQHPDGSWGNWKSERSAYKAMHFTWCAICGLRVRDFEKASAYERFLRKELSGK